MFLVNKQDEWAGKSMNAFLKPFTAEFRKIEELEIPIIYHSCSALQGTNVDSSLSDFFRRML